MVILHFVVKGLKLGGIEDRSDELTNSFGKA